MELQVAPKRFALLPVNNNKTDLQPSPAHNASVHSPTKAKKLLSGQTHAFLAEDIYRSSRLATGLDSSEQDSNLGTDDTASISSLALNDSGADAVTVVHPATLSPVTALPTVVTGVPTLRLDDSGPSPDSANSSAVVSPDLEHTPRPHEATHANRNNNNNNNTEVTPMAEKISVEAVQETTEQVPMRSIICSKVGSAALLSEG